SMTLERMGLGGETKRTYASENETPWLTALRRTPDARMRLVTFPYAGGGPSVFQSWATGLPSAIEPWSVVLPGREHDGPGLDGRGQPGRPRLKDARPPACVRECYQPHPGIGRASERCQPGRLILGGVSAFRLTTQSHPLERHR